MAADEPDLRTFDGLTDTFASVSYARTENQKHHVDSLLDEINSLNFNCPVVANPNKAVLLIHQCCSVVPTNDVLLIEKCCTLVVNLIRLQKVRVEGRTLTFTIEWAVNSLKHSKEPQVCILKCLESLMRDNIQNILELLPNLIGDTGVIIELTRQKYSLDVQLWAIKCLEAITFKNGDQNNILIEAYFKTCIKEFLDVIMVEKEKDFDEYIYCKLITSCLRGINNVLIQNPNIVQNNLGMYLGICQCYMNYCIYSTEWIKPQQIIPSNMSILQSKPATMRDKKGGKITKQRKQRKSGSHKKDDHKDTENTSEGDCNLSSNMSEMKLTDPTVVMISDSDFSDSEQGKTNKVSVTQGKVRQAALSVLLSLIKVTDKHTMFGYWSSFLPDGSPSGVHSLNHCILKEPSPRGRIAALNVVSCMLNGSRLYLSQAEISTKTLAFTPFSMVLGTMIQELHKCLCHALNDTSIPVLTQVLKCLALLVQATPYHRLEPGLVTWILKCVRPFIRHKDATVQVAALIVLGCVVSSEPVVPETAESLTVQLNAKHQTPTKHSPFKQEMSSFQENTDFSSDEELEENLDISIQVPWILEKCLRNLGVYVKEETKKNTAPAPVKLESLQLISALCRNYFEVLLEPYIIHIAKALEISLNDKYTDLRLHAGRAIDSIGHAMQYLSFPSDESKTIERRLSFWQILLNCIIKALLQSEHTSLRAVGCDCLGSIGLQVYEHLPREKQIIIITLLFSSSRDDENNVRGAAVRALAISVLYPTLCQDPGYIADTAEAIIRTLADPNLSLRIKSSWSLGNLSDALVLNINSDIQTELPTDLALNLLAATIKLANDNDKIKSNCARTLGNLLRLISNECLEKQSYRNIVEKGIDVLVNFANSCANMKVRWNSCYAIGNFLKNKFLYSDQIIWQASVFNLLMNLVTDCKNFKVRINSALALSVPETRSLYGKYYLPVWESLLEALESSQNIEDFTEYKHRDNLVDQICLSLSYLVILITLEDIRNLTEVFTYHCDSFRTQMNRVQERLVPEKTEILLKASEHLCSLKSMPLSNNDCSTVKMLHSIYNQEHCY